MALVQDNSSQDFLSEQTTTLSTICILQTQPAPGAFTKNNRLAK